MLNLSVIIPVHNGVKFIDRAVRSVQSTSQDIEIVLVENGSTDDSWDLLNSNFSHLKILKIDSAGKSNARNLGAKKASNPIVTFLDQDDEFNSSRFKTPYLEFALSGGIVIGTQAFLDSQESYMPAYIKNGISRNLPNYVPISMLISRTTFLDFNGFDTTYSLAEDFELLTRLMRKSVPIKYVNDTFLTRHFHENNDSHRVNEAQQELFQLLRKHSDSKKEQS